MTQENQNQPSAVLYLRANPGNFRTCKLISFSNTDLEKLDWKDGEKSTVEYRLTFFSGLGNLTHQITDVDIKIVDFEGKELYAEYR